MLVIVVAVVLVVVVLAVLLAAVATVLLQGTRVSEGSDLVGEGRAYLLVIVILLLAELDDLENILVLILDLVEALVVDSLGVDLFESEKGQRRTAVNADRGQLTSKSVFLRRSSLIFFTSLNCESGAEISEERSGKRTGKAHLNLLAIVVVVLATLVKVVALTIKVELEVLVLRVKDEVS